MARLLEELIQTLDALPEGQRIEAVKIAQAETAHLSWLPNFGTAQVEAYECLADELFYGGEAGGGKSDLLIGTALNNHRRGLILRRLNGEVGGFIDRLEAILETNRGVKRGPPASYRTHRQLIMFGGCQHLKDWEKYRGEPKDFIGFDEVQNFIEEQYTSIIAWNRSTFPGQRIRSIATGNPPTKVEGMWVNKRWAPWLDPNHPRPALAGELRYFTTIEDQDTEVDGPGPVVIDGVPLLDHKGQPVIPKSRTFIPAELEDNPDLAATNYSATLSALPGVLRRSLKEGDFTAGLEDDRWQLFPTAHIDAAMARWSESGRVAKMTALGADIAQGGPANTVLAMRHGGWFDKLLVVPGRETPDGPTVGGLIFANMRDACEVIIDMGGGYGGATRDHLRQSFAPTLFNGSEPCPGLRDRSGVLKFRNMRAAAHWHLREALDPDYGSALALPPDPELRADLAAIHWESTSGGVLIQAKAEIAAVLGRSTDRSDALIMAHFAKGKTNGTRAGIANLPTRANTSNRNPRRR